MGTNGHILSCLGSADTAAAHNVTDFLASQRLGMSKCLRQRQPLERNTIVNARTLLRRATSTQLGRLGSAPGPAVYVPAGDVLCFLKVGFLVFIVRTCHRRAHASSRTLEWVASRNLVIHHQTITNDQYSTMDQEFCACKCHNTLVPRVPGPRRRHCRGFGYGASCSELIPHDPSCCNAP